MTERAEAQPAQWFVCQTRSNRERVIKDALCTRGFESYLPTWREESRWSDRTKVIDRPLFPGYLFFFTDRPDQLPRVPGIVGILGTNLTPEPIPADQMDTIQRVCASMLPASPCAHVAGERVTVARGPLAGTEGVIVRTKGARRLVVSIAMLNRAVSVEIDADTVTA